MSNEKKANLRWWIAIAIFSTLLFAMNYKRLPSLFADLATQGITIMAWMLWVKVFMDIYAFFYSRRLFNELTYITVASAVGCSLVMWFIHDGLKEVLGVLYFAAAAAAVIAVVFHPVKKK